MMIIDGRSVRDCVGLCGGGGFKGLFVCVSVGIFGVVVRWEDGHDTLAKSESLFEGPLQGSSQWFGRQSYLRFRSGLVLDNDFCDFGVCGGGFARALCIGSCGNMARYIYSCLPLRTMSIFVMFWGFMSKFQKDLANRGWFPAITPDDFASICINKSNADHFETEKRSCTLGQCDF
jgi:hypothetical protein